jgi:hypothetical protein
MKDDPDINQTLLDQGADEVRRRHDRARKFNRSQPPHSAEDFPRFDPTTVDFRFLPLGIEEWLTRDDLQPSDLIMGHVLSTTSRVILDADTGIGKTNFVLALFAHGAAGRDFLHWRCPRPRRMLLVDGEMPRALLKERAEDVVRRLGEAPRANMLNLLSTEDLEDFPPLNCREGHDAIKALIKEVECRAGGPIA